MPHSGRPRRPPEPVPSTPPRPNPNDAVATLQEGRGRNGLLSPESPSNIDAESLRAALVVSSEGRYRGEALLGRGGMGEVLLCRDTVVGREVALKRIATPGEDGGVARARFLREARVQGQLEHPAVPPLYDLGVAADGSVFFTMKCLRGRTLSAVLGALREGDEAVCAEHGRHRLLHAFVQACRAVDFAHRRGVVHRDLKPGNLMLGDYGELYVLDWGLAKLGDEPSDECAPEDALASVAAGRSAVAGSDARSGTSAPSGASAGAISAEAATEADVHTRAGAIVGTLGYLAPEQGRGERAGVRSDVYALGAILYEILALEPLHARELGRQGMLASTLLGPETPHPAERAPERAIPPELDAMCVRACALDPAERFPSARALADALEHYLDGDRDLAARRKLAAHHAADARALAERALQGEESARRQALAAVGRALALDPENAAALAALVRVLAEPPRELPHEVKLELERARLARLTTRARATLAAGLVGPSLLAATIAVLGVRDVALLAVLVFAVVVATAASVYCLRHPRAWPAYVDVVMRGVVFFVAGRVAGPLLILPALLTVASAGSSVLDYAPLRRASFAMILVVLVASLGGEALGWLPASYGVGPDGLWVRSAFVHLASPAAWPFIGALATLSIVIAYFALGRVRAHTIDLEAERLLHAWHLKQLVPRAEVARS